MYLQTLSFTIQSPRCCFFSNSILQKINSAFTVHSLYHKYDDIATCFCDEKPTNAEIAVFLCRKLLIFGVEYGIMTDSDKMH